MDKEELIKFVKELKGRLPSDELRRLGIDVDDPEKFLLFLGVVTGAIQIVKRGNKYYYRITPPQNMPTILEGNKYPERTKEALYYSMKFMIEGKGNPEYVKKKWEELKASGKWKKEEKLLTDKQLSALLDRFKYMLPLLFGQE